MSVRLAVLGVAMVWMGCSGSSGSGFGGTLPGQDGGGLGGDATTLGNHDGGGITLGNKDGGNGLCVPPSCADLNATCGAVTDKLCGGVVQCGTCKAGESCGAKKANQCGLGSADGGGTCTHETCASQGVSCGAAGDGCGGTLACGTCSLPQICGGDPAKPGKCGCTGTCSSVPTCTGGATTTLTGKVYDPAGVNGLYNVLVYVPNDTTDSGLQPFPAGVVCDVCGATAAGDPLVTTYTAPDGTFTLSGVPVGASIPLVIQLGRWRRQFTVPVATSCGANSVTDKMLEMPQNHTVGDMPRIAIVSGGLDPVECVLRKMGIQDSEFTNPGGGGYINFYAAATNPGETLSGTPAQSALFAATGGPGGTPEINNYDMAILECEGQQTSESSGDEAGLAAYMAAGGRAFASDFAYSWLWQTAGLSGAANWNGDHSGEGYTSSASMINTPTTPNANPIGTQFQEWMENASVPGASSDAINIYPAFPNTTSIIAPTVEWLYSSTAPIQFTYNTPLGAAPANQCGRVTFSDWHAEQPTSYSEATFPSKCTSDPLTPQQAILEFMLFDLSACVQPYTPVCTPSTCAAQGIECGYAGDGCGNALTCGSCATGQSCGGGGAGKCGTTVTCTPKTCAGQGIQCGPAGDGCGNEIQCGNCPTGEICGLSVAGQCGMPISK